MRRWVIPVLLTVLLGGAGLWRLATTASHPPSSRTLVHDPAAYDSMKAAMTAMGYEGKAFTGYDWRRSSSCDYHTYLVHPGVDDDAPFLFVRSMTTGDMRFLRAAELDEVLKQHVTYDGKFWGVPHGVEDDHEYYSLGSMLRNGSRVYVYVGFDETACGLKVADVWYWAPRVNEKVKLNLQLLP